MKLKKKEAEERIKQFFKDIRKKKPEEVRKIKRLAMHFNIKLGAYRKKFCKYCFSPRLKVESVKNKVKVIVCENCGRKSRWKV